jgi:hypothetical protein
MSFKAQKVVLLHPCECDACTRMGNVFFIIFRKKEKENQYKILHKLCFFCFQYYSKTFQVEIVENELNTHVLNCIFCFFKNDAS